MAVKPKVGRKPREPMPKGEEAEKELQRIRRNERRKRRHAIKRGELSPEEVAEDDSIPAPIEGFGTPSGDELRSMFNEAFGLLGGTAGLVAWGRRYPKEFYAIWARLTLPKGEAPPQENSLEALLAQLGD